jgi:hypothetical protein
MESLKGAPLEQAPVLTRKIDLPGDKGSSLFQIFFSDKGRNVYNVFFRRKMQELRAQIQVEGYRVHVHRKLAQT